MRYFLFSMKATEDTLQLITSISELSVVNGPLAGKQWNEALRWIETRQENSGNEMWRWDKTVRNWMFALYERFGKHCSCNPANYILKIIFKDSSCRFLNEVVIMTPQTILFWGMLNLNSKAWWIWGCKGGKVATDF